MWRSRRWPPHGGPARDADGAGHRRQPGDRPRGGDRIARRRSHRRGDPPRHRAARRAVRGGRRDDRRGEHRRRGGPGGGGARTGPGAGCQRRHDQGHAAAADGRARLRRGGRCQPRWRVPRGPPGGAGHGAGPVGPDHPGLVDGLRLRRAGAVQLRRGQGRPARPGPLPGLGAGPARHHGQHRGAGPDRHGHEPADLRAPPRGASPAHPAGPCRHRRGRRRGCPVPPGESGRYVTGAVLPVSGGLGLGG